VAAVEDDEGVGTMAHALDEVTPLRWRPVRADDLREVADLFELIERHDDCAERHGLDDLREHLAHHGDGHDRLVGTDAGRAVALGWNLAGAAGDGTRQVVLSGGVHPSWRHLGIGQRLLGWQLERARAHLDRAAGPDPAAVVVARCDEKATGRRGLYRRLGLHPVRRHVDLFRALSDEIEVPPTPAGIELVRFGPEVSEEVRRAHNDAFADVARARPVSAEDWAASNARDAARPEWSWVALDVASARVVGYAINSANPAEWEAQGFSQGWTDRLGVRRDHRGRGLARALLVRSMRSFADVGLQAAGLGVDTDRVEGPLCLYAGLGYTVADSVIRHEAALDPRAGGVTPDPRATGARPRG
jgi:mycothiol synthase